MHSLNTQCSWQMCTACFRIIWFLQVHVRYPKSNLRGTAIKRTIATRLVAPVRASGDVDAFRITWRAPAEGLARAWDSIVSKRITCDWIVSSIPTLQTLVACISGVFNTAETRRPEQQPVYPSVSYWVVFEGTGAVSELAHRMSRACPDAQLKHIVSSRPRPNREWPDVHCGTLFTALEDRNSSNVYEKIIRCVEGVRSDRATSYLQHNAKLVVVSRAKYVDKLHASLEALKAVGLDIACVGRKSGCTAVCGERRSVNVVTLLQEMLLACQYGNSTRACITNHNEIAESRCQDFSGIWLGETWHITQRMKCVHLYSCSSWHSPLVYN